MSDAAPMVTLIGGDGKQYEFPRDRVPDALASGFRHESDEEFRSRNVQEKYGDSEGLALGTGALRGLTFGLSDVGFRALGASEDRLRGIKEANPMASLGGEIGGAVIPTLLSGGTSAVASGAKVAGTLPRAAASIGLATERATANLLGRGLAGKVLSKAAGGAAESALYGVGQTISEDALGEHELTAERLLSNVGLAALMGGGAAGALGLGGAGLASAKRAVESKMQGDLAGKAREWLGDFAKGQRFRAAFGVNKRAAKQLDHKTLTDRADDVLKEVVELGDDNASIGEKLRARLDDVSEQHNSLVQLADEATEAKKLQRLSPREVATRIEETVLPKINRVEQPAVFDEVTGYVQRLRGDNVAGIPFSEARKRRRALQDMINYNVEAKPVGEARQEMARAWNDLIDEKIEPVLKDLGFPDAQGAYKKLRQDEGLLIEMSKHAQDRVQGNQAIRLVSPSDHAVGIGSGLGSIAMGGSGIAGLATGAIGAAANKAARTYGPAALAVLADNVAKLSAVSQRSNAVTNRITQAVDRFMTGAKKAPRAVTPASATIAGEVSFLQPASRAAETGSSGDRRTAYRSRLKELSQLAANPAALSERVSASIGELSNAAPGVSAQLAKKMVQATSFLQQKAPKPRVSYGMLGGKRDDYENIPSTELAKWGRYLAAVENPVSVVESLENGSLTREGVEVLREIYPKTYEQVRMALMARATELQEELPYSSRIQLSVLFDAPLDPTMQPAFIASMQSVYSANQPQQGGPQAAPRGGDAGSVTLGDRTMPESMRIQGA